MSEHSPFTHDEYEESNEIGEGVFIEFQPDEWMEVKAIIDENRATIHTIKQLGKELVDQEIRFWDTIYAFYPEAKGFQSSMDMRKGILYVGAKAPEGFSSDGIEPPFSMSFDGTDVTEKSGRLRIVKPPKGLAEMIERIVGLSKEGE